MTDHLMGGDVIELRRLPAPDRGACVRSFPRDYLLDHLQRLGLIEIDQFALAINDLQDLRRRCGQDAVHCQATANLLAALATLRCGLGFDAVDGIIEAALADNDRLRRRS